MLARSPPESGWVGEMFWRRDTQVDMAVRAELDASSTSAGRALPFSAVSLSSLSKTFSSTEVDDEELMTSWPVDDLLACNRKNNQESNVKKIIDTKI
jgi:hypothetical protein